MFPVDSDPRFGTFGLRTDCARCGAHLPVNGPVDQVGCAECGHHMQVPEELWRDRFRAFEKEYPTPTDAGTVIRGDVTWRWTTEVVSGPACVACGVVLSGEAEEACAACGRQQSVFSVPAPLRRAVKTATRVFGGVDDQTRPEIHSKPVVLSCPSCGGGLSIGQDRARITPCDFCGSQVHLPDVVWRQLHPPVEVVPFTVRF